jgi:chromosomal replication initiator protein
MVKTTTSLKPQWAEICKLLKKEVHGTAFGAWIASTSPIYYDSFSKTLYLQVKTQLAKGIIEGRYREAIAGAARTVFEEKVSLSFILPSETKELFKDEQAGAAKNGEVKKKSSRPLPAQDELSSIDFRYSFDNFVADDKNRFARAVAMAVAKHPGTNFNGTNYNPLFIHGGSGLGKTHLLHAIGGLALETNPNAKVLYVDSEEFTSAFILATRTNSIPLFKEKYRSVDILLLDDIQFIDSTKEKTSEEVFHTYNALYKMGKQLVFSSDRPPSNMLDIDERLSSRLSSGIIASVAPPSVETRIAILSNKALEKNIEPSEILDEIITFISSKIINNIRELEGAFETVIAPSILTGAPLSVSSAKAILSDYVKEDNFISPEQIIATVCSYFNITVNDIRSSKREKHIVFARHIAIFLIRVHLSITFSQIGMYFGGRDHSTIMHSFEKINSNITTQKISTALHALENVIF